MSNPTGRILIIFVIATRPYLKRLKVQRNFPRPEERRQGPVGAGRVFSYDDRVISR
jgi:hypothetical protein